MSEADKPPSSPLPDSVRAALCRATTDAFESKQVPWLARLVDLPSHTAARDDVEVAAAAIDAFAGELGLRCKRVPDPQQRFADHRVYASPQTTDHTRSLALVGHVDTVFPRSLGFLKFVRDDGPDGPGTADIIRGPGVLDMKSGLSAILFAIRAVAEVMGGALGGLPLRFVCVSDEEVGSPSSRALYKELAPVLTEALVFEAGREHDQIVVARKGGGFFELRVTGRAAHAGNDHAAGANAIHGLARLVQRVEALTDYGRGVTLNVGIFEGGTAKNTVPDRARCEIDARFCTAADAAVANEALAALAGRPFAGDPAVPASLRDLEVELRGGVTRPPMEPTPASVALRVRYERHAAAVGLAGGEAPLQGGGSDGNLLAALGVPTIDGLGPYGKCFHQVTEWSSLASLQRRTQALACFLAEAATQVGS